MGEQEGGPALILDASMEDLFAEAVKSVERHNKKESQQVEAYAEEIWDTEESLIVEMDVDAFDEPAPDGAEVKSEADDAKLEEELALLRLEQGGLHEELEANRAKIAQLTQANQGLKSRLEEGQKRLIQLTADVKVRDDQLEHLKHQIDLRNSEMKRLAATLKRGAEQVEGLRRRHAREKKELLRYGMEKPFRGFLDVLDNLERALQHQDASPDALKEGVDMTLAQFLSTFAQFGVKPVDCTRGSAFDPNVHEAMLQVETHEAAPGTVYDIMQKGYLYHERLLRPAMVTVARAGAEQAAGPTAPSGAPEDADVGQQLESAGGDGIEKTPGDVPAAQTGPLPDAEAPGPETIPPHGDET